MNDILLAVDCNILDAGVLDSCGLTFEILLLLTHLPCRVAEGVFDYNTHYDHLMTAAQVRHPLKL